MEMSLPTGKGTVLNPYHEVASFMLSLTCEQSDFPTSCHFSQAWEWRRVPATGGLRKSRNRLQLWGEWVEDPFGLVQRLT